MSAKWAQVLYSARYPTLAIVWLFWLSLVIHMWLFVPHFDFELKWDQDIYLTIREVPEESRNDHLLQANDVILAINNQPITTRNYSFRPFQDNYTLTISRSEQILEIPIELPATPDAFIISRRLPATLLSFIYLGVGGLILAYADRTRKMVLNLGYCFLISGTVVIGIQGSVLGASWGWLGGVPLAYINAVITIYVGLVPRHKPLSKRLLTAFYILHGIAITLGVIAIFETLYLFPQGLSMETEYGVSPYRLVFTASGLTMLIYLGIVIRRTISARSMYLKQQMGTLTLFLSLSILPVVFFSFLPRAIWDIILLPFPVALGLLSLLPLGYFYIIYRKGYLGLDLWFSNGILIIVLALFMLTSYGLILILLQIWMPVEERSVSTLALAGLPIWTLGVISHTVVRDGVWRILFGNIKKAESILSDMEALMAERMEMATLQTVLEKVSAELFVTEAVLMVESRYRCLRPIASLNNTLPEQPIDTLVLFDKMQIRALAQQSTLHPLIRSHDWIELLVPLMIRTEQIGFLALGAPKVSHFNLQHIRFIKRVANSLAIGTQAILLFESLRQHSADLKRVQQDERRRIQTQIHEDPLQVYSYIQTRLDFLSLDLDEVNAGELQNVLALMQTTTENLRSICEAIYPRVIDSGIEMLIGKICTRFEIHARLEIDCSLDLNTSFQQLESPVLHAIYHILLEAFNNIVKHTKNKTVSLAVKQTHQSLQISVADQGPGIPSFTENQLLRGKHLGIISMHDWAVQVGGTVNHRPNQPTGTCVELIIPLHDTT